MYTTNRYPDGHKLVEITVTEPANVLHRRDHEPEPGDPRTLVILRTHLQNWTEGTPPAVELSASPAYEVAVESRIRERYSLSAELAILRQRDTKPEEFATYNEFAEACKAEARESLNSAL